MKKTQKDRVLDKLKQDGYVDNFFCLEQKITLRLGAVVHLLKKEGVVFDEARSGFVERTKNWRYYLLKGARQPWMPKYRYEEQTDGSMREIPLF